MTHEGAPGEGTPTGTNFAKRVIPPKLNREQVEAQFGQVFIIIFIRIECIEREGTQPRNTGHYGTL